MRCLCFGIKMILSISKAPVLATLLIGVKRRLQIEDIILYVFSYSKVCVLKKFTKGKRVP